MTHEASRVGCKRIRNGWYLERDEDIVWCPMESIGKFIRELRRLATYVNITFDGDCLNILYIINEQFKVAAEQRFNPRNAFYISRNDGNFNIDVCHCRDTLINATSMLYLSRDKYSSEQIDRIRKLQAM